MDTPHQVVENSSLNCSRPGNQIVSSNTDMYTDTNTCKTSDAQLPSNDTKMEQEGTFTSDYSIWLEDGHKVRKYQEELAQPGIRGENCIVVAPTGSGKTLVAALVISDHLKKNQHKEKEPRVIFIVDTRPLAQQQKNNLCNFIPEARIECSMGDGGPSVSDLLPYKEVIVCTAGKLLEAIKAGKVTFDKISLMVIDECHHTKKSSPQANIMIRYLEQKAEDASMVPQVMGLTASPGAGDNSDLDEKKTIDHLVNLCAHMDATIGIVTVKENQDELDCYTNKSSFTLEILQRRDANEPFIETIANEMKKCEKHVPFLKCTLPKWSQEYETTVQQKKAPLELSSDPRFRDQISTLRLLRCYSQALNMYMDLRCDDAVSILQEYDGLPTDDTQATPHERMLKENLCQLIISLDLLPPIENPLLKVAEEKLAEKFSEISKSRGIFFVRTKKHAWSICKWIEGLPTASSYGIRPRVLTGHTRDTGTGMTQVAQEEVMESFRKGEECNLLIATSVAEEGLDIPACNLVIRFQHVSNEIAKVQTKGRARAENSEGFTILSSDSKKTLQEIKNDGLLQLMEKCILQWLPSGDHLVSMIKKQQEEIVRHHKQKIALRKRQKSKHSPNEVELKCKRCKTTVCEGSDIYLIGFNHRTVPNETFRVTKLVKRPHHEPRPLGQAEQFAKTHKIYCKNCDADWGVLAMWPEKGLEFPVLKCKSFIFEVRGCPHGVGKWSDAPFEIPDLSVWLEIQNQTEDSDSE